MRYSYILPEHPSTANSCSAQYDELFHVVRNLDETGE